MMSDTRSEKDKAALAAAVVEQLDAHFLPIVDRVVRALDDLAARIAALEEAGRAVVREGVAAAGAVGDVRATGDDRSTT